MYIELIGNEKQKKDILSNLKDKDCKTYNNNKIDNWETVLESDIEIGKLYNSDETDYTEAYWKSFDQENKNFHMAPTERKISIDKLQSSLENINVKLLGKGQGSVPWTKQHKFRYINRSGYEYLIGFQTLTCDNNRVNCYLDKVQFMRYSCCFGNINYNIEGKFKMMYPAYNKENWMINYDSETGHCVVNTTLIYDNEKQEDIEKIAKAFSDFIKVFEGTDKQPVAKEVEKALSNN